MSTGRKGVQETVSARLRALGVKGVLVPMAKNGQIRELRCEMPTCYCPKVPTHFEPWPEPRGNSELNKWSPNADHYPTLRRDGGKLKPWNVRLAHKFCNNMDYGWRMRIRTMLERDPTLSFDEIAEALNKKRTVLVPPNKESWTAELVREAYVS